MSSSPGVLLSLLTQHILLQMWSSFHPLPLSFISHHKQHDLWPLNFTSSLFSDPPNSSPIPQDSPPLQTHTPPTSKSVLINLIKRAGWTFDAKSCRLCPQISKHWGQAYKYPGIIRDQMMPGPVLGVTFSHISMIRLCNYSMLIT